MTATCRVGRCSRPVGDAWICSGCATALEADLTAIPGLARDLDLVLARLTVYGDHLGRGEAKPIPFDSRASAAKDQLKGVLVGWVRLVREERYGTDVPGETWLVREPRDDLGDLADWLKPEVEWLRHHQAGHEAVDEITGAVERVRQVSDRPTGRWYAGACDACSADLYAKVGALAVQCPCGAVYDVAVRREWLLQRVEDQLCTAADMSRALTSLAQPVTAERIRKWRERGRLMEHARDRRGQPLYRVGDVRGLLAAHPRRA
jgi:hypothetical protein